MLPFEGMQGAVWQSPADKDGEFTTVRIMNPTRRYPDSYVRFPNKHNQPIGLDGNRETEGLLIFP